MLVIFYISRGILVIFLGLGDILVILVIFRFQEYFGHFLDFRSILVNF